MVEEIDDEADNIYGLAMSNGMEDEEGFFKLIERAAREYGHPEALCWLGHQYLKNEKREMAAACFVQAAEKKGIIWAKNQVGLMYFYGIGLPEDENKAIEQFQITAKENDLTGTIFLASATLYAKNDIKAVSTYISNAASIDASATMMIEGKEDLESQIKEWIQQQIKKRIPHILIHPPSFTDEVRQIEKDKYFLQVDEKRLDVAMAEDRADDVRNILFFSKEQMKTQFNLNGKGALALGIEKEAVSAVKTFLAFYKKNCAVFNQVNQVCIKNDDYYMYPLALAASIGNLEIVKMLLDAKAMIDEISYSKEFGRETALGYAARKGMTQVVSLLLDHKALIEVRDNNKKKVLASALISAVLGEKRSIVEKLLATDLCRIDTQVLADGRNALTTAAAKGNADIFRLILNNVQNDDKNILNQAPFALPASSGGDSALVAAARYGHKQIVQLLLKRDVPIDKQINSTTQETALFVACQNGKRAIVDLLLSNKANPTILTQQNETTLHAAARSGNVDIIKALTNKLNGKSLDALVEFFFKKDRRSRTTLWNACRYANINAIRCLLHDSTRFFKKNESAQVVIKEWMHFPDAKYDLTPLDLACKRGLAEVVDLLLKKGANPNHHMSKHILRSAAPFHKCLDYILAEMHKLGASKTDKKAIYHINVDAMDKKTRQTPLMIACAAGNAESVTLLLQNEASIKTQDKDGFNALHYACGTISDTISEIDSQGYAGCVEALLEKEPDLLQQSKNSWPLLLACKSNNIPACQALLKKGAHPDGEKKKDVLLTRPIHAAAKKASATCLALLLRHKADIFVVDEDGRSPLHMACLTENIKAVETLLAHASGLKKTGALLAIRDNKGKTAMQFACLNRHQPILHRLCKVDKYLEYVGDNLNSLLVEAFASVSNHEAISIGVLLKTLLPEADDKKLANMLNDVPQGDTALYQAVAHGYSSDVHSLLEAGADPNLAPPPNCRSPLHAAVAEHNLALTKMLLEAKADPKALDANNESVLLVAAQCGNAACVKMILDSIVCPHIYINCTTDNYGRSALHFAAAHGHVAVCDTLCKAGAKWSVTDSVGETPFHAACYSGHALAPFLKMAGSDCAKDLRIAAADGTTVVHILAEMNRINELVSISCENLFEKPDKFGRTPLHRACMTDAQDVVLEFTRFFKVSLTSRVGKGLVQIGLDALEENDSAEGFTPLHTACDADASNSLDSMMMYRSLSTDDNSASLRVFRRFGEKLSEQFFVSASEYNHWVSEIIYKAADEPQFAHVYAEHCAKLAKDNAVWPFVRFVRDEVNAVWFAYAVTNRNLDPAKQKFFLPFDSLNDALELLRKVVALDDELLQQNGQNYFVDDENEDAQKRLARERRRRALIKSNYDPVSRLSLIFLPNLGHLDLQASDCYLREDRVLCCYTAPQKPGTILCILVDVSIFLGSTSIVTQTGFDSRTDAEAVAVEHFSFGNFLSEVCQEKLNDYVDRIKQVSKQYKNCRMLGIFRFMVELFQQELVTETIMLESIKLILGPYFENQDSIMPDDKSIEAVVKHFVFRYGEKLDAKSEQILDPYFDYFGKLEKDQSLLKQTRSMLLDLKRLRENRWQDDNLTQSLIMLFDTTTIKTSPEIARDAHGRTPLDLCCELGRKECAQLLLKCPNVRRSAPESIVTALDASTSQQVKVELIRTIFESQVNDPARLFLPKIKDKLRRPLAVAVKQNYVLVIKEFLRLFLQVDAFSLSRKKWIAEEGPAALALACSGNEDRDVIVNMLLQLGAQPEWTYHNYKKPLYEAAARNFVVTMRVLIQKQANINLPGPLHIAARQGHENAVNILLENRTQAALIFDENGDLPLHLACQDDTKISIVTRLLSYEYDAIIKRNEKGYTPFLCACNAGAAAIVKEMLEFHEKHNVYDMKDFAYAADGTSALHHAIVAGHLKVVVNLFDGKNIGKALLDAEAPATATAWLLGNDSDSMHKSSPMNYAATPLIVAAARGAFDIMQFLLKNGASDNEDRALMAACDKQQIQAAKTLLLHGSGSALDDGKNTYSPLWLAARRGHAATTKVIYDHVDQDLEKRVQDESPLDIASKLGHSDTVQFLLEQGADCFAASPIVQQTPLHRAAAAGKTRVIKILLEQKGHRPEDLLTLTDVDGNTPLHLAARFGKLGALQTLLKHARTSTILDAPNNDGDTPLHTAVNQGKANACVLLLEHGADRRKLKEGAAKTSPLDFAYKRALNDSVRRILVEYEAFEALELFDASQASSSFL